MIMFGYAELALGRDAVCVWWTSFSVYERTDERTKICADKWK